MDSEAILKIIQQQQEMMLQITKNMEVMNQRMVSPINNEHLMETLSKSINEFSYDPDSGFVFESWFKRYKDLFEEDCKKLDDAAKVRLLLRKLNTAAHERYVNYILPKQPRDYCFSETLTILSDIFGKRSSIFNIRYNCLKLVKNSLQDIVTYTGIVNKECENFKLSTLTEDQFKCLIFVCGLQSPEDADIRLRLLHKIETNTDITLQNLADECKRLINLKNDTIMVEKEIGRAHV